MTTKRSDEAATTFSRVCAAPPPFTIQPSGAIWSAPSIGDVEPGDSLERLDGETERSAPAPRCRTDVATQRSVRPRAARAGRR